MLNPTEGVLVPGRQASLARVYMKNRCGQAREFFYNVEDSSTHVTGVTVVVHKVPGSSLAVRGLRLVILDAPLREILS